MKDRLIRFGIPLIFSTLFIIPVLEYVRYLHNTGWISFQDFYIKLWLRYHPDALASYHVFNFGHLWFIEHLLIYSILYASIRIVLQRCAPSLSINATRGVPLFIILLFIAFLGFVTHLMRTSWGFPVNRWLLLLGFIQVEPAHIPQYLSLFVLGILVYRLSILEALTKPRNMLWFIPGLGIYTITVIQFYIKGRSSAMSLWEYREALLCVGVCIGLLALFRNFFNRTGRIMQMLAESAFGAYIIHLPIVVALQYAFDPVQLDTLTIFLIVSFFSITASFLGAFLIRLIPGMKRVL